MRAALFTVAVVGVIALPAPAGDLDPPAGPIAPTMRTLDEVDPRTVIGPDTTPGDATATAVITSPGSNVLGGDFWGESGKDGIRIESPFVTIDLNGFTMFGLGSGLSAITTPSDQVTVRNGTIYAWDGVGADLDNQATIRDIRFDSVHQPIHVSSRSHITDCSIDGAFTPNVGITATGGGIAIQRCSVRGCTTGIEVPHGAHITDCVVEDSDDHGIVAGNNAIIVGNTISDCGLDGVRVADGAQVLDNLITETGQSASGRGAITCLGSGALIKGNTCVYADYAVRIEGDGNLIVGNFFCYTFAAIYNGGDSNFGKVVIDPGDQFVESNAWANIVHTTP